MATASDNSDAAIFERIRKAPFWQTLYRSRYQRSLLDPVRDQSAHAVRIRRQRALAFGDRRGGRGLQPDLADERGVVLLAERCGLHGGRGEAQIVGDERGDALQLVVAAHAL